MPRHSLCIRVQKNFGEKTTHLARNLDLSNRKLLIHSDEKSIYVPISRKPSKKEHNLLDKEIPGFQVEFCDFNEHEHPQRSLSSVLQNQLSPHQLANLPKALDIIGDIAVVEIPSELETYGRTLGEAILQTHRNVKTVLAKAGAIRGTFRLREFILIAGEPKTTTVHKEFGSQYYVDLSKAYFSPRLSYEHKRVASLVQKSETVVDLFAGVGPFSVIIARSVENVRVYALDINPDAVEFLKKNIRLNRVQNCVFPIFGDAKKIVEKKLLGIADRVIMYLPESALEYVDVACKTLKAEGGIIHFYHFKRRPDSEDELRNRFLEAVEGSGRKVDQILTIRNVRETGPNEQQTVIDARIV